MTTIRNWSASTLSTLKLHRVAVEWLRPCNRQIKIGSHLPARKLCRAYTRSRVRAGDPTGLGVPGKIDADGSRYDQMSPARAAEDRPMALCRVR